MLFESFFIGILTGFISAFFGIGGSSIDTPLLREILGLPPYLALATPLPATLITISVALITYWKNHLINYRVFRYSLIGGFPGIISGSYISPLIPGNFLMLLTAFILFIIGTNFILNNLYPQKDNAAKIKKKKTVKPSGRNIITLTALSSLFSGILANGGGLFLIPIYVMLLRLKMKEAVATSLLTVAAMSIPASIIHFNLGHIDLAISAAIGLGTLPAAYLGAKLDLRTKPGTIQLLFGLLLIIFACYFFIRQLNIA
jgi:uncharacterized membrane protein YfcA